MCSNNTGVRAQPVLRTQPSPVPDAQSEQASESLLDSLMALSATHGLSLVEHGARLGAVDEFLFWVLTHLSDRLRADIVLSSRDRIEVLMSQLTAAQCSPVALLFRQGVGDAMARTEEVVMPNEYRTAASPDQCVANCAGSKRRRTAISAPR